MLILKKEFKTNPETLNKEISILYELGLEDYEIQYLLFLKTKREMDLKWSH